MVLKKKFCALLVFNWQKYVPKKKLLHLSHITKKQTKNETNKQKKQSIIPFYWCVLQIDVTKVKYFHLISNFPFHNMHQLNICSGSHKMYQTFIFSKECIKIFLRIFLFKGEKNINKKLIHSLTSCIHKLNQKQSLKARTNYCCKFLLSPFSLYIQTAQLLKGKKEYNPWCLLIQRGETRLSLVSKNWYMYGLLL